ncbi:hypothetical protein Hanom_Chr11g01009041 [Helianthus anomalus]
MDEDDLNRKRLLKMITLMEDLIAVNTMMVTGDVAGYRCSSEKKIERWLKVDGNEGR